MALIYATLCLARHPPLTPFPPVARTAMPPGSSSHTNAKLKAILKAGMLFEGKYRIMRPLGAGSFAVVVHARHEVMERDVALKFLKPKVVASSPEVSERFVKEVQIASRLIHPNVVAIYDFGVTEEGIYYMVQEYVSGKTVDEVFLGASQPLELGRVERMMQQVLSCLEEAHAQGVIHRDLKPSNLMFTMDEEGQEIVKVLDFGVAKLLEKDEHGQSTSGRQSTKFIGTPIYMSPEQILGKEVTPASDLYSAGLMLYEMLTGDPPVEADQIAEVVQRHLSEKPFQFRKLPKLPPLMQRAILKATERRPELRFQSAAEFAALLRGEIPSPAPAPQAGAAGSGEGAAGEKKREDVFLGRNYIDIPEDGEEEFQQFQPLSFDRQHRARLEPPPEDPESPRREARALEGAPAPGQGPLARGDLELDMEAMRSVRKRYAQPEVQEVSPPRASGQSLLPPVPRRPRASLAWGLWLGRGAWVLGLGLMVAVHVLVLGALVPATQPVMVRVVAGFSLLFVALVWYGIEHLLYKEPRRLVPGVTVRLVALSGGLVLFCVLIVPGYAAKSFQAQEASVLFQDHPEGAQSALALLSQGFLGSLGAACAAFARMVPWG